MKTGGTEVQTLRQVEALAAGGYQCVTVCYFEYDYKTVELFKQAGSEVVCLSASGQRPSSQRDIIQFLRAGLRRVVDKYKPAIAHVQYMNPGAIPILLLYGMGVETILATSHTNANIYRNLRLIYFLQRHILKAFICVTENAERSFFRKSTLFDENYKLKRRNHFTIPNCLSPKESDAFSVGVTSSTSDNNDNRRIGFAAQLKPIKGADFVIPAFSKVLECHPDCRLIIVGDGELREEMEKQQHSLGIPDEKVVWQGYVEHNKLQELFNEMDIVWGPSRSEGFGLSILEAMAHGCAVVASAVGGLTEIVHDGFDGLLFPCGDIYKLAELTCQLLDNPEKINMIKGNAIANARNYSFDKYKERILSLYKQL